MWFDLLHRKLAFTLWVTNIVSLTPGVAQISGFFPGKHGLMPPAQSVAPAILTADSESTWAGSGRNWSQWYRLGAGKAPSGYTLQNVEFWLTGDCACGASAECRELVRNDAQVLWEFRLRGRAETAASPQGPSVAHIRVFYRPQQ